MATQHTAGGGVSIPTIDVDRVSKRFGDTQALRACSLRLRPGEIHALVGENGSGKSTMAKLLSGVFRPDGGTVRIGETAPLSPAHARGLGVATVFQEVLVAEGASVVENLYLGHDGFVRSRYTRAQRYENGGTLLRRLLDAEVDLDASVESLSLSARQWVVIARALLGAPRVLILDEASAALDQSSAERLLEEMARQRDLGTSVLFVTHRIAELHAVADRATVLRDGSHVGTLGRGDITEDRLLELMTGEAPASAPRQRPRSRASRVVLKADAVEIRRGKPLSIELRAGEVLGVAGLEGHGQSHFVRALAGIERPFGGSILAVCSGDHDATEVRSIKDADRAGIVYVSGDRKREGVVPNLSVLENFGLPLLRRRSRMGIIDRGRILRAYREQRDQLAIRARTGSIPIGALSGGNQQKVLIGRALALDPRVIVLNDPTRGVDVGTKHEVYRLLRGLAEQGTAVCFLSTELEEFLDLADRVAVFRSGGLERVVAGEEIAVESLLAAMFGRGGPSTEVES